MIKIELEWEITPAEFAESFTASVNDLEGELEKAVEDVLDVVGTSAKQYAPVDTGELRDSIEWLVTSIANAIVEAEIRVGAKHGVFQEFGTIYHQAQPYLRPALDEHKDFINSRVEEAVEAAFS